MNDRLLASDLTGSGRSSVPVSQGDLSKNIISHAGKSTAQRSRHSGANQQQFADDLISACLLPGFGTSQSEQSSLDTSFGSTQSSQHSDRSDIDSETITDAEATRRKVKPLKDKNSSKPKLAKRKSSAASRAKKPAQTKAPSKRSSSKKASQNDENETGEPAAKRVAVKQEQPSSAAVATSSASAAGSIDVLPPFPPLPPQAVAVRVTGAVLAPHQLAQMPERYRHLFAASYLDDIYRNMLLQEAEFQHMRLEQPQTNITDRMREVLVDWQVEVQVNFRLFQESLHLGVNVLDRFLEVHRVDRSKLQLAAATALLVASKHEELHPPEIADFVYICADTYTRQEVLQMEQAMLIALDFRIGQPLAWVFLMIYCLRFEIQGRPMHFAEYLLECTLQKRLGKITRPSVLAAAAVDCALRCFNMPGWSPDAATSLGLDYQQIIGTGVALNQIVMGDRSEYCNVHRKYSHRQYGAVSTFRIPPVYQQ